MLISRTYDEQWVPKVQLSGRWMEQLGFKIRIRGIHGKSVIDKLVKKNIVSTRKTMKCCCIKQREGGYEDGPADVGASRYQK